MRYVRSEGSIARNGGASGDRSGAGHRPGGVRGSVSDEAADAAPAGARVRRAVLGDRHRHRLSYHEPYFENPEINFFSDYKSALQEYVQADQKSLEYELVKDEEEKMDQKELISLPQLD